MDFSAIGNYQAVTPSRAVPMVLLLLRLLCCGGALSGDGRTVADRYGVRFVAVTHASKVPGAVVLI
jgi:hypothetical protein